MFDSSVGRSTLRKVIFLLERSRPKGFVPHLGGESRLERGGGVVSEEGGGGGGGGGVVVEVGGTWGMWEVGRVPLSVMTTPLHK